MHIVNIVITSHLSGHLLPLIACDSRTQCPFWKTKYFFLNKDIQEHTPFRGLQRSKCIKFGKMTSKNPYLCFFTPNLSLLSRTSFVHFVKYSRRMCYNRFWALTSFSLQIFLTYSWLKPIVLNLKEQRFDRRSRIGMEGQWTLAMISNK